MYKDIFVQLGLNSNEAIIYEFLLKSGKNPASEIIKKTPLKRGVIYNTLETLAKKGLISEKKDLPQDALSKNVKKISYFSPEHPEKLRKFIDSQEDQIKKAKNTLESNINDFISNFNLVSGQPGVRYFEGIEGVKKVINDTLINNKNKEILAFSDVAGYIKYLKKWNQDYYSRKRRELEIYEKVIIPDNESALEYMADYIKNPFSEKLTDILFIDHKNYPFNTEVCIYENKVSFVTFSEKAHIGVIIENQIIHDALKSVFNYSWDLGKKIGSSNNSVGNL